jgi:hypothetical protein
LGDQIAGLQLDSAGGDFGPGEDHVLEAAIAASAVNNELAIAELIAQQSAQPSSQPTAQPQASQPQQGATAQSPQASAFNFTRRQERELAALAYSEQRNVDTAQHEAIVSVIINRVVDGSAQFSGRGNKNTIHNVIQYDNQFQGAHTRAFRNAMGGRVNNVPGYRDALQAVRNVERNGVTTRATFFFHGTPSARTLARVGNITPANPSSVGNLRLYVEKQD